MAGAPGAKPILRASSLLTDTTDAPGIDEERYGMAVDCTLHVEVLVAGPLNRNGPVAFSDDGTGDFRRDYRVESQVDERAE